MTPIKSEDATRAYLAFCLTDYNDLFAGDKGGWNVRPPICLHFYVGVNVLSLNFYICRSSARSYY